MSDSISTTIDGEFGGPFAADDLLHLAVETGATPARRKATAGLIKTVMEEDSSGRFYTDLAMFHLIAARLALRTGDLDEATSQWVDACQMLNGYGYRKDRTVFELLDPLPELIKADPLRGRKKVSAVQPLAMRIPAHTDGRETRHARSAWWDLLALADPMALANLVGPAMVARCNLPSALHETARQQLWQAWQLEADPILASLLRYTLDLTLDPNDAAGLERLLASAKGTEGLDALIVSLVDERHTSYSVSNNLQLLDRDAARVQDINVVADRWGAPHVTPWSSFEASPKKAPSEPHGTSASTYLRDESTKTPVSLSPGLPGLAQAARAWRGRGYGTTGPNWDIERFANAIGYRLVDLIQDGRAGDAYVSLWSVAEADRFDTNQDLLRMLAEGLERMEHAHLAAVAHTLRWTRSRGGGGWLTFGGKTSVESLCQALALNPDATMWVIAEETQRVVRGSNLGVTQAIIYAFTLAEVPASEGVAAHDVAFECWDEAAAVISARAPRVHASDDPDLPYVPAISDNGAPYLGDLDLAFALAIVAGVSNSEREQKRRSMLAVRMLLDYAPAVAGKALQKTLPALSDPGTLAWILGLIHSSSHKAAIVDRCGAALTELALSDYLAVRSLARRLMPAGGMKLPMTPPDSSLLEIDGKTVDLWLPPNQNEEADDSDDEALVAELERLAGTRLARGEAILPRYRQAVLRRLSTTVNDKQFESRLRRQLDSIGRDKVWPDAYLAIEEAIESALQSTAAGGRLAMLANGEGIVGPQWEDQLASAIMDDPLDSLDLEATRHPRPPLPIPPGPDAPVWIDIMTQASGNTEVSTVDHAYSVDESEIVIGMRIRASSDCAAIAGGSFNGWRVIGSQERRTFTSSARRESRYLVQRYFGLEFREPGDKTGLISPPLSPVDSIVWVLALPPGAIASSIVGSYSFVGLDSDMERYGDAEYGLGIPEQIIVPTGWLRELWRLDPLRPYVQGDKHGKALALVTWRTEYVRSDYHLPWPSMQGSAIVVRPDLLHRLESEHGDRLTLRDFIVGDTRMFESPAS